MVKENQFIYIFIACKDKLYFPLHCTRNGLILKLSYFPIVFYFSFSCQNSFCFDLHRGDNGEFCIHFILVFAT